MISENDFGITENGVIRKYTGKAITIPQEIRGIAVQLIVGNHSSSLKGLTEVTIPNSMTETGYYVFAKNQLAGLVIPKSIMEISENAFSYNRLTALVIQEIVTKIGAYAFQYNQLVNVVILNSVTKISIGAFMGNQLNTITILGKVSLPRKNLIPAFGRNFEDFHISNNKRSRTYLFDGKDWSIKE